jgi:hypothetical protein
MSKEIKYQQHHQPSRESKPVVMLKLPMPFFSFKILPLAPFNLNWFKCFLSKLSPMKNSLSHIRFPGFKEVRLVPGKSDIAFVEYDTDLESAVAKQSLHGYRLGDKEMKVTFAKK